MSDTGSISSGVAARYATALFDLAKDAKSLPAVESDLDALDVALAENDALKLSPVVGSTLGLMAQKRRLPVVPALIEAVRAMIADEKGEITAHVSAAKALTAAQEKSLAATLKKSTGKDVKIKTTVDASLIGGLIVKVGSKMIDSSIKSKLSNLQNVMKEVG